MSKEEVEDEDDMSDNADVDTGIKVSSPWGMR
jgi:hypothetical protein